jgi:hypothetical protein
MNGYNARYADSFKCLNYWLSGTLKRLTIMQGSRDGEQSGYSLLEYDTI